MTLAEFIATNPDDATATNAEAWAWAVTEVDTWQDVPWVELQFWLHAQGITRATLNTAAAGTGATATAAQHVLDTLNAGQPLFATDQRTRDIIAASSLSGPAKTALTVLATTQVTRLTAAGFPGVTFKDVRRARQETN